MKSFSEKNMSASWNIEFTHETKSWLWYISNPYSSEAIYKYLILEFEGVWAFNLLSCQDLDGEIDF